MGSGWQPMRASASKVQEIPRRSEKRTTSSLKCDAHNSGAMPFLLTDRQNKSCR
jgi:hypothetical protein